MKLIEVADQECIVFHLIKTFFKCNVVTLSRIVSFLVNSAGSYHTLREVIITGTIKAGIIF